MKRVKLLSLGGTIAMTENSRHLANPALDAAALLEKVPALETVASVEAESFMNVPSPFLVPRDILRLARRIEALAGERFDGVVVTQGTDTLEETAYLLDLLIPRTARIGVAVTDAPVEVIWAGMGTTSSMLDAARESGARGIVLQAVGAGHVPPTMIPGVKRLVDAGIPVLMTSRCHGGRLLTGTYGYEGSETHLHDLGVIFGDGLATSKARAKLTVLLGAYLSIDDIRREFEKNYY
ncbi:MAG: asparaginase domain-containing protein [Bacillota bacterium]